MKALGSYFEFSGAGSLGLHGIIRTRNLLFKYPWGLRLARAMMEVIFVLLQVPPGTPTGP